MALDENGRKRLRTAWRRVYRMRALVGIAAGLVSVGTFAYSYLGHTLPKAGYGELVAVIQDARTKKPVGEASIEIVTDAGALMTTVTSGEDGRAQKKVKEGGYTLRISHPRFGPETRKVRVNGGETSEIHVALAARPAAPREEPNPVKKLFKGLGM